MKHGKIKSTQKKLFAARRKAAAAKGAASLRLAVEAENIANTLDRLIEQEDRKQSRRNKSLSAFNTVFGVLIFGGLFALQSIAFGQVFFK